MEITLPRELEEFLLNKVKHQVFASLEEAIIASVRESFEADEHLKRQLDEGIADVEAGRVSDWDVEEVKEEIRRKYGVGKKAV